MLQELREYARIHGPAFTLRRSAEKAVQRVFGTYDRLWRRQQPTAETLENQRVNPPAAGLISVIIPVYNTAPALLQALLDSLRDQTYAGWEAILYDGASTRPETAAVLDAPAARDSRFRVFHGRENLGIAGNTNAALAEARGVYTALADHDDWLSPEALWQAARVIADSRPDMLYSDEDRITEDIGFLLNAFKYGVPPHAGLAYGLDRLCMLLVKADSIREVIAFPKVKDASCLMTNAPDVVDPKQLEELQIALDLEDVAKQEV